MKPTQAGLVFGYARVSTEDQLTANQKLAIKEKYPDADIYFDDGVSGKTDPMRREEFAKLFHKLRKGDTVVIYRLDRLSRKTLFMLQTVEAILKTGATLVSLSEDLDFAKASGQFHFQMISAVAEYERNLISERTKAGLKRAATEGRFAGRPKTVDESMIHSLAGKGVSKVDIAKALNISRQTVYRVLGR